MITGSTGYDHIELDDLRAAGVAGYCTPGYCSREVADFALACALAGLRGVVGLDRAMQVGRLGGARGRNDAPRARLGAGRDRARQDRQPGGA